MTVCRPLDLIGPESIDMGMWLWVFIAHRMSLCDI